MKRWGKYAQRGTLVIVVFCALFLLGLNGEGKALDSDSSTDIKSESGLKKAVTKSLEKKDSSEGNKPYDTPSGIPNIYWAIYIISGALVLANCFIIYLLFQMKSVLNKFNSPEIHEKIRDGMDAHNISHKMLDDLKQQKKNILNKFETLNRESMVKISQGHQESSGMGKHIDKVLRGVSGQNSQTLDRLGRMEGNLQWIVEQLQKRPITPDGKTSGTNIFFSPPIEKELPGLPPQPDTQSKFKLKPDEKDPIILLKNKIAEGPKQKIKDVLLKYKGESEIDEIVMELNKQNTDDIRPEILKKLLEIYRLYYHSAMHALAVSLEVILKSDYQAEFKHAEPGFQKNTAVKFQTVEMIEESFKLKPFEREKIKELKKQNNSGFQKEKNKILFELCPQVKLSGELIFSGKILVS